MGILYQIMGNDGRGDWKEFREGPKKNQAVAAEDVRRVAQTYLTVENRGVATYTRKGGAAPARALRAGASARGRARERGEVTR
jgi:predicted Zn-dependent peptidase